MIRKLSQKKKFGGPGYSFMSKVCKGVEVSLINVNLSKRVRLCQMTSSCVKVYPFYVRECFV